MAASNGNTLNHVRIQDEFNRGTSERMKMDAPIRGRQLLLLVHRYYKTNGELGAQYGPKHIFLVRCANDRKLESFLTDWFTMLARIPKFVDEDLLRDHFLGEMRNCTCMDYAIKKYDAMLPGDPD